MASIFIRGTKYWLRYHDPITNNWLRKPTPLIAPRDKRKAEQLKAETTAKEMAKSGAGRMVEKERWNAWVPAYFRGRYQPGKTRDRYLNSWAHLASFMDEKHINVPAAFMPEHNIAYVAWKTGELREKQGRQRLKTKRHRSRNTAIWDVGVVLRLVLNEAKRRGYVDKNVASKRGIAKDDPAPKPAVTDDQVEIIRAALNADPRHADLATALEIAINMGCRISETMLHFNQIDFNRGTKGAITFLPKGGQKSVFTAPITSYEFQEWMRALVERRRGEGHTTTCTIDGNSSKNFGRVCRRLKVKGPDGEPITMHCFRVTFVTRALMAGHTGEVVRRLVNHSDAIVNRVYQRLSIEGLQELGEKLKLTPLPGAPSQSSSATPLPPAS